MAKREERDKLGVKGKGDFHAPSKSIVRSTTKSDVVTPMKERPKKKSVLELTKMATTPTEKKRKEKAVKKHVDRTTEIDELFAGKRKRKLTVTENGDTGERQCSRNDHNREAYHRQSRGSKSEGTGQSSATDLGRPGAGEQVRFTDDGLRIYTYEEIMRDQPPNLNGPCPFECSCCF